MYVQDERIYQSKEKEKVHLGYLFINSYLYCGFIGNNNNSVDLVPVLTFV